MLWYKAWLETRWRFVFTIGWMMLPWLAIPLLGVNPERLWRSLELESVLLYCFAALFLAGAGINSQTFYAATAGYHGSMLYTLSLPVSRRRLGFVIQFRSAPVSPLRLLRGMIMLSYPLTALMRWAAVVASVVCTGVLVY